MTTQEFIFNVPLYQKVVEDVDQIVADLGDEYTEYGSHVIFDGYNPFQKKDSTFCVRSGLSNRYEIWNHGRRHGRFEVSEICFCTLRCRRYGDQIEMCLWLDASDHSLIKVGQYPSVATIHIGRIKQYKSVLSESDLKEFTRAIGLAANGVGIGSFVYMRRIFEKLIWAAAQEAIAAGSIVESEFARLRMDEKIDNIKVYLPDTLVELKEMYGILSKGIHELSEEECLVYFDIIRNGIELILDDKLEHIRKAEKRKSTMEAMAKLNMDIKNNHH